MSKMNLSRCAAVGIAGLTAMSSVAVVAAAASQDTIIYELKYKGVDKIGMLNNAGYATQTNQFCVGDAANAVMNAGYVVDLTKLADHKAKYVEKTNNSGTVTTATVDSPKVWDPASFDNTMAGGFTSWTYKEYDSTYQLTAAKLLEQYGDRAGEDGLYAFKSEAERTAAKTAIKNKIVSEYNTLATRAYNQFVKDVDAAKKVALDAIKLTYETEYNNAQGESDPVEKSVATANAQAKRTAMESAVNASANTIKSEFRSTFTANNFRIDADGFEVGNCPISYGMSFAGVATTATYSSALGGAASNDLKQAKYYNVSTSYNAPDSYAFKGEIQLAAKYTAANANALCISGNNWLNYEIIDYSTNSGGNTTPGGGSTTGGNNNNNNNNTTTATTWYPDSSAYRAASDVSYQGENGSWYTSSSAAQLYGGGYTGVSKNSNFSAVNSSADGKAIYFNSTTGTYSTSSSTYSYIVKEATTSTNNDNSDDPYYNYFFGNGGSTTNRVPSGSPAINGTRYAGWTNIANYIAARGKSGTVLTINMNEGTVVPSNVLSAAKSKNVTLTFKNKNGSTVTVRPSTSMAGNDLNTSVTYNVKDVKSSLVSKAKKVNSAVSSAQIRVGADGSIGGTETVGVKFSTRRSGYTVKAYRLTETGSLRKEATGTINSSGRVNFNLTKGGSYVLVVCR